MIRRGARLALALAVLAAAALPPAAHAARRAELRVLAAASLAGAFGDLARAYERVHPDVIVRLQLAGSQQLAAQLDQGAPGDVFAAADERWMTHARAAGLVTGKPVEFARNRLVAIVPRTNPARLFGLHDLARHGIRFVTAADAVPVGHYTRVALANLSRDPAFGADFASRVLANVVSEEENVRSIVGRVQLGEADAGIVYRSDVTPSVAHYVTVYDIPEPANVVASYPIAMLRRATRPDDAQAFVALVRSTYGRAVLAKWGFLPPAE